ncbi:MAG: hypothetical protein ACXW27_02060 [Allosphingosinicella sp.]
MADAVIAPYVSQGVDAGQELRSLGLDECEFFLLFLQKTATRKGVRPYWQGRAFHGRTILRKDHGPSFIIYVIETEKDRSLRVTLIYAGLASAFANQAQLDALVHPRLKDYFA